MICCTHEKTKSHKSIYEYILFFVKNSAQCCDKKFDLVLKKKIYFCKCKKKKKSFWRKKSDLFLNKTKSFALKKKNQVCFWKTKKLVLDLYVKK